jgi:soluble lytic murein transglycosylase-like protein
MDSENFFDEEYYNEVYFEDEYISQQIGCLPILFAVVGIALIMAFALSRVEISIPTANVGAVNLSEAAGLGGNGIASLFTPEVQYWSGNIEKWSQQTGIDANLIATVMQIESCGDPRARSSAGAMGLFQVMPYHFENGEDPYKPATNALRGLDYLHRALEARGGVVRLGFAGYNGGITGAKRPESQWANETQRYVYWGTGIYADAAAGKANSDRLNEWLGRGGASLCSQAAERLGLR